MPPTTPIAPVRPASEAPAPDGTRGEAARIVPVYYLAHPVSSDVAGNIARARRWFAWLVASNPDIAFSVPWLPYVESLPEDVPSNRARGLRDDVAMVAKCDGIVLCGGRISGGMRLELESARAHDLDVVDLTSLGDEPPPDAFGVTLGIVTTPRALDVAADRDAARVEAERWRLVARQQRRRIDELEKQLVHAGLGELRDATFDIGDIDDAIGGEG